MGKTKEYEAKTTQEALDKAVADTGIPLSELKFEIISQGGAGIFGLSLKKAKIKVALPQPQPQANGASKEAAKDEGGERKTRKSRRRPRRKPRQPKEEGQAPDSGGEDRRTEGESAAEAPARDERGGREEKSDRPKRKRSGSRRRREAPRREQAADGDGKGHETQVVTEAAADGEKADKEKTEAPARPEPKPETRRTGWAAPGQARKTPRPQPVEEPEPEPEPEVPEVSEPEKEAAAPAEIQPEPEVEEAPAAPSGWAAPSRVRSIPKKERKKINVEDIVAQPKLRSTGVDIDLTDGKASRGSRGGRPPRRSSGGGRFERGSDRGGRGDRRDRYDDDRMPEVMPRQNRTGPPEPYTPKVTDPNGGQEFKRTDEDETNLEWAKGRLEGLLEQMVGETKVDASWVEEKMYFNFHGDGSGILIGRKGQTLDAIQFVIGKMVDKHSGRHYRIMVDTEGYRGRREEALVQQAEMLAEKAINSGRPARTGPLNPHERRIIHLALMENERVRTGSQGEGTYKRVVVSARRGEGRD